MYVCVAAQVMLLLYILMFFDQVYTREHTYMMHLKLGNYTATDYCQIHRIQIQQSSHSQINTLLNTQSL